MYGVAVLLVCVGGILLFAAMIELVAGCIDRWEDGRDARRAHDEERRELRHACWREVLTLEGQP